MLSSAYKLNKQGDNIQPWRTPFPKHPKYPTIRDQLNKTWHIQTIKFFVVVHWLSHVRLFGTPQTAAWQASLSFTVSQSLLKLKSIESVIPSNHLIFCRPLLLLPSIFPSIRFFSVGQFFASGGESIGASASASVLPINIQDWFPLGWTYLISL